MNEIAKECKDIIKNEGINLQSTIEYDVNGKVHTLTIEWIVDTFMQTSSKQHQVFFNALQLAVKSGGLQKFFEDMGQLILMTHLSEKM